MFIKTQKWALISGMLGQLLFVLSWLFFGFSQGTEYSWLAHSISDMYAVGAPFGTLLTFIITICGLLTILYILFGLLPTIKKSGWLGIVGSILLVFSIYGLGDLLSFFERQACRLADAGCTPDMQVANFGGKADVLLSSIGLILFVIGIIFVGYAFRKIKSLLYISKSIVIGGYIMIGLFIIQGVIPANLSGLSERLIALTGASLLYITAYSIHKSFITNKSNI